MTQEEKELLSCVICDLLTGNHLLGRKRSDEHRSLMGEFYSACVKVDDEEGLTDREKELFAEMVNTFYGGMQDMCEQLIIDYDKLLKSLK